MISGKEREGGGGTKFMSSVWVWGKPGVYPLSTPESERRWLIFWEELVSSLEEKDVIGLFDLVVVVKIPL